MPDAPSLAPGTAAALSRLLGPSATGRVSQCARNRRRSAAPGLKRATKLRIGSESPDAVTWVHACTMSVSASGRSRLSSQAASAACPGVPGIRGPNATCASTAR